MKNKSFTLIELLVVIVIIGILAGVIIVSVSSSINKANFAKAQAFSNTVQQELLLNLVSEWTFDEGGAEDTWGNNDGVVTGATYQNKSTGNCVCGGCYSFDGTNDYIDFGDILSPSRTEDRTYSFWVNLKAYNGTIFSTGNLSYYKGGFSIFRPLNLSTNYFSYELNDSPYNFNFNCSIPLNNWIFFVITTNPNNLNINFKLYKDGILKDEQTKVLATGNQARASFKLGAQTNGVPGIVIDFLNGFIDDFRVYDAILSTAQVKQQYIAGLNSLLANGNISKEEYNERIENIGSNF